MDGTYDIYRGAEKIGKAQVVRKGLYFHFRCCCNLSGSVIYRLIASEGENTVNLGIPVPDGDCFRLETKIAKNKFGSGTLMICAQPRSFKQREIFAPIYPDEPFAYIKELEKARMVQKDGQIGVLFDRTDDM